MMNDKHIDIPTAEQLKQELKRLRYKSGFIRSLRSTVSSLIVVVAVAIIISTMMFPALKVTGTSMTPTLQNEEIVLCSKLVDMEKGDIIAFYYNNKVLLKRIIGKAGDVIDISDDGTVCLNGEILDEPYIDEKSLGECNIEFPYQVPDNRIFVMGDHRAVSIDSRSTTVGCIAEENVIGKVFVKVWPIKDFGFLFKV